jgi:diketogulonate reductase-like aldo/keto reductase
MEKFYAEGRIMSIGVSNFNVDLLKELLSIAVVKPHLIQNWSEPGNHDDVVRDFASEHDIIYQPYASLRNLNAIPPKVTEKLQAIADERKLSLHQVALRFFVQTGCAVIPRSSQSEHLKENLEVFKWSLTREEMNSLGWTKDILSENEEL